MEVRNVIEVNCFGERVGRLGYDEQDNKSYFQYDADFLQSTDYRNLFPKTGIIKRVAQAQVFSAFSQDTFRGLPPQIADSLPDMFGNLVFKTYLEQRHGVGHKISVLEQLAYVANRGMGALEYYPSQDISRKTDIDLSEIIRILKLVMQNKRSTENLRLNNEALLNIFKIGTSAGGARPKILISEHKESGKIIPGDLEYSSDYHHYIVKLSLDDELGYAREVIEYSYYLTAQELGIRMMPSKLIDHKHFCTTRFDRQNGEKQHVLTATGMTGWDFKNPDVSSYENLFELAVFLEIPYAQIEELFRRMVFNVIFSNTDDHLKNHSFIYRKKTDRWELSPAYDLTYSLNPLLNYTKLSRALSVNGKRTEITAKDLLALAEKFTVKNSKGVIEETLAQIKFWEEKAKDLGVKKNVIERIKADFLRL